MDKNELDSEAVLLIDYFIKYKNVSLNEITVRAVVRWSWLGVTEVMVVQRPLLYEIQ